jgi:hypothetical protein
MVFPLSDSSINPRQPEAIARNAVRKSANSPELTLIPAG